MVSRGPSESCCLVQSHSVAEILFDFKVDIRKSGIPNSGHGAFLTFRGARMLKQELQERNTRKLESRCCFIPKTMTPLHAMHTDGFGVKVTLTGRDLHGNRNSVYWPETLFPLQAYLPGRPRPTDVQLTGENLHYDSDEDEPLGLSCCPKRIGFLGLHTASDYLPADDIEFASSSEGCGYLSLGRYGPAGRTGKAWLVLANILL